MNRCLWSHENCVGTVVLFAVGWRGIQRERALSASDSRLGQIWVRFFRASAGGGIAWGRIRSPAGEPRRWKQSTGLFPRAGFRIRPPKKQRKTRVNQVIYSRFGGGGRIRTIEAIRSRFTVCPLWPLGNSPI